VAYVSLLNLRDVNGPVNNIFHRGTELFENGHDVGPDDLGLLSYVSFGTLDELAGGWVSCPLGRDIGDACVGRNDGDVRKEILVWWRAGLGVEMLERRHVDRRAGRLKLELNNN
jgi:hypothetical protein